MTRWRLASAFTSNVRSLVAWRCSFLPALPSLLLDAFDFSGQRIQRVIRQQRRSFLSHTCPKQLPRNGVGDSISLS